MQFDFMTAFAYFIQKIEQPEALKPLRNKMRVNTRGHSVEKSHSGFEARALQSAGARRPRRPAGVTHVAFAEVHGHLALIPMLAVHGSPHQQV